MCTSSLRRNRLSLVTIDMTLYQQGGISLVLDSEPPGDLAEALAVQQASLSLRPLRESNQSHSSGASLHM
jgi:4-hydroxyphenylpyruvate dioxygenase-like putative hemolysin